MSKILEKLGLTAEEVRAAFGVDPPVKIEKTKNYLFRHDQNRMRHRMKFWDCMLYARYLSGYHPRVIAACLGVSEETVRVRLRKSGLLDRA